MNWCERMILKTPTVLKPTEIARKTSSLMMMWTPIAWSWRSIGKSFCFEKPTTSRIGECWTTWRMT